MHTPWRHTKTPLDGQISEKMVRRGSGVDDFVEAQGVTWASQQIARRAAPGRCCPQKR